MNVQVFHWTIRGVRAEVPLGQPKHPASAGHTLKLGTAAELTLNFIPWRLIGASRRDRKETRPRTGARGL